MPLCYTYPNKFDVSDVKEYSLTCGLYNDQISSLYQIQIQDLYKFKVVKEITRIFPCIIGGYLGRIGLYNYGLIHKDQIRKIALNIPINVNDSFIIELFKSESFKRDKAFPDRYVAQYNKANRPIPDETHFGNQILLFNSKKWYALTNKIKGDNIVFLGLALDPKYNIDDYHKILSPFFKLL